ncbi:MAG: hypothetical protein S4CHLAM81_01510 [Chlamydiales bacterium]|nr:hypothetical protein [Chlamydiales bacterium]MCH9634947.1 hypothetical protein [Chlamydiales bacterium]MCH9703426.1 hypothetical protein [Chlamydiota bacterium]
MEPMVSEQKSEEKACKIFISCDQPSADGKMSVEMTYEGDPSLASYLLERAQSFIENEEA